jgi:hypothetical protein
MKASSMNQTWSNVYLLNDQRAGTQTEITCEPWGDAKWCQNGSSNLGDTFIRVEERWNGHWLRPPVGIRASDCSTKAERLANDIIDAMGMSYLWFGIARRIRQIEITSDRNDGCLSHRLMCGFRWAHTTQGDDYWTEVHDMLEDAGQ